MTQSANINELIDQSLEKIDAWAKLYPDIRALILFGSRAGRTHRAGSDIDICLLIDQYAGATWYTRWFNQKTKWKREFCRACGLPAREVQFCTVTSEQVVAGLREGCRVLYLRKDDPNTLRPIDYRELTQI